MKYHGTTILAVQHKEKVVVAGDGQVTLNDTVIKHQAKKVRKIYNDKIIVGFAGASADALNLSERLEAKLERYNGNLTRSDLKNDTPYNTYTRHGLPPTPIAMPGRAAIHAALHPEQGDELYFVATGLGDGSHAFSATKAEHDAAVAEYLKRLRRQRLQGK